MRTLVKLALIAATLTAGLSNVARADDVAARGGPGGGAFRLPCAENSFLLGVALRSGTLIDGIRANCLAFDASKNEFVGPPRFTDFTGGPGGGIQQNGCSPERYVSAIKVGFTNGGNRPKYLDYVELTCTVLTGYGGDTRVCLHSGEQCRDTPGLSFRVSCPTGQAAAGLIGRSGLYVDAVGLICRSKPNAAVAGGGGNTSGGKSDCPAEVASKASPGKLAGFRKCLVGRGYTHSAPSRFASGSKDFSKVSETWLLCLINAERTCRGLPALKYSNHPYYGRLSRASRGHATAAAESKWWVGSADSHKNPQTGSTVASRIADAKYCENAKELHTGENTYHGAGKGSWGDGKFPCPGGCGTPAAAVDWWMNVSTSGHREAILNPKMEDIGMAVLGETADPKLASAPDRGLYVINFGFCRK